VAQTGQVKLMLQTDTARSMIDAGLNYFNKSAGCRDSIGFTPAVILCSDKRITQLFTL
jgi:hypothetical protein